MEWFLNAPDSILKACLYIGHTFTHNRSLKR
jgi:hypothetical protein